MWKVLNRIYLGDYESGRRALAGARMRCPPEREPQPFAAVVSLCPVPLSTRDRIDGPSVAGTEWLHSPIADGGNGEEEFERVMALALPFIERHARRGNVMVHCAAGMSRSVSLTAALLLSRGVCTNVSRAFAQIADAKAAALGPFIDDPDLLISPAAEFRTCLNRLYSAGRDGRPGKP